MDDIERQITMSNGTVRTTGSEHEQLTAKYSFERGGTRSANKGHQTTNLLIQSCAEQDVVQGQHDAQPIHDIFAMRALPIVGVVAVVIGIVALTPLYLAF
jgi:flagellar motor component MotA